MEVPWAHLEAREESSPALVLPADATLNYNQSVARPAALHPARSGLESTCLVLTTGLGNTIDILYMDGVGYKIACKRDKDAVSVTSSSRSYIVRIVRAENTGGLAHYNITTYRKRRARHKSLV